MGDRSCISTSPGRTLANPSSEDSRPAIAGRRIDSLKRAPQLDEICTLPTHCTAAWPESMAAATETGLALLTALPGRTLPHQLADIAPFVGEPEGVSP